MAVETSVKDRKGKETFWEAGGARGGRLDLQRAEKKKRERMKDRERERETDIWVARVPLTRRGGRGRDQETHRDRLRRRKARARFFLRRGVSTDATPPNATDRQNKEEDSRDEGGWNEFRTGFSPSGSFTRNCY